MRVFAFVLVFFLCTKSSWAADARKALEDLYSTYSLALSKIQSPRAFLILNPSRFVDEWSSGISDPQSPFAQSLASLADRVGTSWIEDNRPISLSNIYYAILFDAQWAKIPLSAVQRSTLADHEKKLFMDGVPGKPTKEYQNYLDLRDKYADLQKKYDNASQDEKDNLKDDLDQAREDLRLLGKGNIFQPLDTDYQALIRIKNNEFLNNAKARFKRYCPEYDSVKYCPSIRIFGSPADGAWARFALTKDQVKQAPTDLDVSRLSTFAHHLLRSFETGGSLNLSDEADAFQAIEFNYAIVGFERPWLDTNIFSSRAWRWKSGANFGVLSDGGTSKGDPNSPVGAFAFLWDSFVFSRDTTISLPVADLLSPAIGAAIQKRTPMAWGPFSIVGQQLGPSTLDVAPVWRRDASIGIKQTQIFGLVGTAVSKSPNPNEDFIWE